MALANHIEFLEAKHAALEVALHSEETRAWHDERKILRLKKDKLMLRDEIARLRERKSA